MPGRRGRERVVVTGIGPVTPIGIGKRQVWENALRGVSGAGEISLFDHSKFPVHFACEVKGFQPSSWLEQRELKRLDRFTKFAVVSSILAVEDAEVDFQKHDRFRCGVVFATGMGGIMTLVEQLNRHREMGPKGFQSHTVPAIMPNAASSKVAIHFGLNGLNYGTVSACASSAHAIALAFRHIQMGDADLIIAGGSDALITELGVGGFAKLGALSRRNDDPLCASRPFDKGRDGFVLGEGGIAVVLESLEHARYRKAPIYAEVLGCGMNSDAHHLIEPGKDAICAEKCMRAAIDDAEIDLDAIDHINAHGTSTVLNDKLETKAIKQVFGDERARSIAINSTKSMFGHLLGASGALEFALTTLAVHEGIVPPTINYSTPDPECDLDYTPSTSRYMPVQFALTNSFGFGGHNCCLCVGKAQE